MTPRIWRPLGLASAIATGLLGTALGQAPPASPERPADGNGSADDVGEAPTSESRSFLEGAGVKVGEGLVLHPRAELQTGYQPNVFYANGGAGEEVIGAAIMRLGVGAALATISPQRMEAEPAEGGAPVGPKLTLRGSGDLTWNQYLSSNSVVNEHNDLGIGLLLDARVNPQGNFTFVARDAFTRFVRPPHGLTAEDVNRDRNELTLGGLFKPGGGAIQGYANYTFLFDLFERSDLSFANRIGHTFSLGGRWQWLPMTQVSAQADIGLMSPSEETIKSSSMPLRLWGGISTLVTPTFGVILRAGYGNGFYSSGANFNSYLALAEGRVAIGPTVRAAFGYSHDYVDSVIANFYADHSIYGRLNLSFGERVTARVKAALRFRGYEYGGQVSYNGYNFCGNAACTTSDRSDVLFDAEGGLDYQANEWLGIGGVYLFNADSTDFRIAGGTGGPDYGGYTWHELVVRATARF